MARKKLILSFPSMDAIAAEVAKDAEALIGRISWGRFENRRPKLFIEDAKSLHNADVTFLADLADPADDFAQYCVMRALPRYGVHSLKIVVPHFPTGTMERVEQEGEIATAKVMASWLSSIPFTSSGPVQIATFDIHSQAERFYFGDGVVPRMLSLMPGIAGLFTSGATTVAFPDAGAQKRYGRDFAGFRQIICHKDRIGDDRRVRIIEGDPSGQDVLIVDDLANTGGTLIQCRDRMMDFGARSVSVAVVHGVFAEDSHAKFTADLFQRVIITDTCPTMARRLFAHPPFHLFTMHESLVGLVREEC